MKFQHSSNNITQEIVFIHIPRTAGSYLERSLCQSFHVTKKWPRPDIQHLFGLHRLGKNHYITLQHLTMSEMDKFHFITPHENQFIFTIIRHPVDRLLSLYQWCRKKSMTTSLDNFLRQLKSLSLDNYPYNGMMPTRPGFNHRNMTRSLKDITYFVLPQYYYIHHEKYHVNCFKYENMEQLNNILPLKTPLKFTPRSHQKVASRHIRQITSLYHRDFEYFSF